MYFDVPADPVPAPATVVPTFDGSEGLEETIITTPPPPLEVPPGAENKAFVEVAVHAMYLAATMTTPPPAPVEPPAPPLSQVMPVGVIE